MNPTKATYVDVRKQFNWRLEAAGMPVAYVRKSNIPQQQMGVAEHAHGGQLNKTKTAGKLIIGEVTLEVGLPEDGQENYWRNWFELTKTTGANTYKRVLDMYHLGPDHNQKIDHWRLKGCWPSSLEFAEHDALEESGVMTLTVVLQCDDVIPNP